MSIWYPPGHDEQLARQDAYEQWLREVDQRDHVMVNPPRVHLIQDKSNPARSLARLGKVTKGFRVSVQGDIKPK
jgi:hypothetical protein